MNITFPATITDFGSIGVEDLDVSGVTNLTGVVYTGNNVSVGNDLNVTNNALIVGNLILDTSRANTVTLTAGTATVGMSAVEGGSLIWITVKTLGTVTTAQSYPYTINPGVGFTVTSTDNTDTSTLQYWMVVT